MVERRAAAGAQVSWQRFDQYEPALADAAIRLHGDGLLPLPDGRGRREQHRHPPTAEDWVALIGDYRQHCLLAGWRREPDAGRSGGLRGHPPALPSVGYRLTRAGIRAAASPVDRVLARSASKAMRPPRSCAPSTASSATGCGPWCCATSRRPAGRSRPPDRRARRGRGRRALALQTLLDDAGPRPWTRSC